jgi:hypothetical protein
MAVSYFLAENLPETWMGRAGTIPWPPRSPYLTPCEFYIWGYVEDQEYQPPMPQSFGARISQATANVDEPHFRRTWEEIEYHIDVCRVIYVAPI